MDFMDWDSYLVFNLKDSRSKVYVEVYDGIVSILNLETRCSSSAASQIQCWVRQPEGRRPRQGRAPGNHRHAAGRPHRLHLENQG